MAMMERPQVREITGGKCWEHTFELFTLKAYVPDNGLDGQVNNYGFREAKGEQILLLNNDTEVISGDWIQEMLMYAQRPDVGTVGAKLYYPDGTVQHAGIGIGIKMLAGHYHRFFPN